MQSEFDISRFLGLLRLSTVDMGALQTYIAAVVKSGEHFKSHIQKLLMVHHGFYRQTSRSLVSGKDTNVVQGRR